MLSDGGIATAIKDGQLAIAPYDEALLQPASYDVTLGGEFRGWTHRAGIPIDTRDPDPMAPLPLDADGGFTLAPGQFALGVTREVLSLGAGVSGMCAGKSSLARIGLAVEFAGFIDPGFTGHVTLELLNVAHRPLRLWPGMAIGQVAFHLLDASARRPYGPDRGSHYQLQAGPTESQVAAQLAEAGIR